jgi:Protein of unknown function (DUF3619)
MTQANTYNAQDQFGRRIASHLNTASLDLPHDISERLRAARNRAVAVRLVSQTQLQTSQAVSVQNGVATLNFGDEGLNIWSSLASLFPLLALVAGLAFIQHVMDDKQAHQLADVDAVLLTDDLPVAAYTDPGFLQFLKTPITEEAPQQD